LAASFLTGHLIGLLEILGTLSMTARELKRLISLFRFDDDRQPNPYTTRLMRAIATMARREGKENALSFFDLQNPVDVRNYLTIFAPFFSNEFTFCQSP
jgi:hypothetical protein